MKDFDLSLTQNQSVVRQLFSLAYMQLSYTFVPFRQTNLYALPLHCIYRVCRIASHIIA